MSAGNFIYYLLKIIVAKTYCFDDNAHTQNVRIVLQIKGVIYGSS